jgi:hypothetical protein
VVTIFYHQVTKSQRGTTSYVFLRAFVPSWLILLFFIQTSHYPELISKIPCHSEEASFATEESPSQSEEILRRWKNISGSE